jgi:hypothetical protein
VENEDHTAIEQLYSLFSHYPFPAGMQGCPCCVSNEHLLLLRSKPLRQLGDTELSRYAFKAMTTWGTEMDFKYYLPRLFELYLSGGDDMNAFVLMDKLSYAGWHTWPPEEQEAIKLVLLNWWKKLANGPLFCLDTLNRIRELHGDTDLLLEQWDLTFDGRGFRNFIEVTYNHFSESKNDWIRNWIRHRKELIEQAFFYFEQGDADFAKKISDTLYIIEHTFDY